MDVASLAIRVSADTADAESKLDGLSGKLEGFAKGSAKWGLGMSAAFTAPFVAAGGKALSLAADMERDLNVLQQLSGATAETMAKLTDQALQLGAETSFSAGEAAGAMLELGKAGLDTEQIMGAIPGVLSLAAAGGSSLEEAAGLAAASLNTFGLEATDVTYIADLMANAANASSASMTDLMAGMRQGGFAFNMAGQDIDDLAASLAILTNNGLTGSDAGTALKNAFMRMMNPTKKAEGVMKELGISFYDANGNMKEMPEIIGMLNKAFAGLTNEQRDAALGTIFLSDGMKAFVPLLELGQEGFEEYLKTVNKTGAAGETANAFMKGLAGAVEYLSGSIESAMISIAMPKLDAAGGILRWIADMVTAFSQLDPAIINAALAFGAVLAAAGPVALAISGIAAAASLLLTPFGAVTVAVGLAAAGFAALKAAAGDGAILSPATLKNIQEWPQPLASLATWAIGAGAAVAYLWNALKPDEDVDAKQMTTLFDTVRMAFGEDTAQRLKDVAGGLDAFGKAITGVQVAVEDTGWFSQDTIDALSELPGKLAPLSLTLLGVGAGFTVIQQALTGWGDADKGMAALRSFNTIFGKEATDNLMTAATHVTAIKDGVVALTTTGDLQPLATALTDIGTALAGIATDKLTELKIALGGMTELGLSVDSNTGKLSIDLKQMMTGIQDAFKTAFSGEDATIFDATIITEWVTARKQDLIDAFEAAFVGTTTTDATGTPTAAPGYVTTWVDARKREVGDALRDAFVGEDATLFDVTVITGWINRQMATIQTELQKQFAGGTPLGDMANNLIAGFMTIQTLIQGLGTGEGEGDGPGKFATAVGIVKAAMDTLSTLKTDALTVAMDAVTNGISGVAEAAAKFTLGVDATSVQDAITGIADSYVKGVDILTNEDNMTKIGAAAGSIVSALATKLGEVVTADLGEDLGDKMGTATGKMLVAAQTLVDAFVGELGNVDWGKISTQLQTFTDAFTDAFVDALTRSMNSYAERKIAAGIEAGLAGNMPPVSEAAGAAGGMLGGAAAKLPPWILDALGFSPQAIYEATGIKAFDEEAKNAAPTVQAMNQAQKEYTVATEEQAQARKPWWQTLREALQLGPMPEGIKAMGVPSLDFGTGGEPVKVPAVYDFSDVDAAMAAILAGQEPVSVPAMPVWDDSTPLVSLTGDTTSPIQVPAIPDWSGAIGIIPDPIDVPATVTEVTAAPGLSLDVPLVSLTGDASMGAASGIQAAANQLTSFQFQWPPYPEFSWPALPKFTWPEYPAWKWPAIPAPSWLNRLVIPRPSWLGELLAWSPTVTVAGGGGGGGGTAPVDPPQQQLTRYDPANPIVINATVAGNLDLEVLAQRVAEKIRRSR